MLQLIHWLSRRSLRFVHAWGAMLGWATYLASPAYRRRFRENARIAGIAASDARPAVAHAGRMVTELPFIWLRPPGQPLATQVLWEGSALMDAALASGRGLVLLTPHLGAFEVCAQAFVDRYGPGHSLTVLYRPARKAWLRTLEETSRRRPGLIPAPASLAGVRQMLRALRQGESVGLLPDQVPPQDMGVWAPFFGRDAYTMTLASRLVLQTGAQWLLMACERLPRGQGYRVRISEPPRPLPPKNDASPQAAAAHQTECAAVVNNAMEHLIRQQPGQYLWGYHRYKMPRSG